MRHPAPTVVAVHNSGMSALAIVLSGLLAGLLSQSDGVDILESIGTDLNFFELLEISKFSGQGLNMCEHEDKPFQCFEMTYFGGQFFDGIVEDHQAL